MTINLTKCRILSFQKVLRNKRKLTDKFNSLKDLDSVLIGKLKKQREGMKLPNNLEKN